MIFLVPFITKFFIVQKEILIMFYISIYRGNVVLMRWEAQHLCSLAQVFKVRSTSLVVRHEVLMRCEPHHICIPSRVLFKVRSIYIAVRREFSLLIRCASIVLMRFFASF